MSIGRPKQQPTVDDRFKYHAPSDRGVQLHESLSRKFIEVAKLVEEYTVECRETSLSLTNLEQAKFWASAAIARYEETR